MIKSTLKSNNVALKRVYTVTVFRPGGFMNGLGSISFSNLRIRQLCLTLFWSWFGLHPDVSWHKDGFMAEAWDKRGNWIQITQINYGDPKLPDFYKEIKYLKAS
jgi:hypothetical protein